MKLVSPFLKRALYPGMSSLGLFRGAAVPGTFCAVTYHGVVPAGYESKEFALDGHLVNAASLRAQLGLLKAHYHVLQPEEIRAYWREGAPLPPRSILLTCDDGLQNVLSDMLTVLQEAGVRCLFFITGASAGDSAGMLWYEELYVALMTAPAGSIEITELKLAASLGAAEQRRATWRTWMQELSKHSCEVRRYAVQEVCAKAGLKADYFSSLDGPNARRFRLLNAEGVRQLAQAGMTVGAHTLSHPVLAHATRDEAWKEIQQSRAALQSVTGTDIWALAYPFGDATAAGAREFEMAEQAGYECAFMNCGGGFFHSFDRFAIPRVHVTGDMTLGEFEAHVSGFHEKLRQRLGRQGVVSCA